MLRRNPAAAAACLAMQLLLGVACVRVVLVNVLDFGRFRHRSAAEAAPAATL